MCTQTVVDSVKPIAIAHTYSYHVIAGFGYITGFINNMAYTLVSFSGSARSSKQ